MGQEAIGQTTTTTEKKPKVYAELGYEFYASLPGVEKEESDLGGGCKFIAFIQNGLSAVAFFIQEPNGYLTGGRDHPVAAAINSRLERQAFSDNQYGHGSPLRHYSDPTGPYRPAPVRPDARPSPGPSGRR